MKLTGEWENVHIRDPQQPDIISRLLESSNSCLWKSIGKLKMLSSASVDSLLSLCSPTPQELRPLLAGDNIDSFSVFILTPEP
jgi:hypothetical protein